MSPSRVVTYQWYGAAIIQRPFARFTTAGTCDVLSTRIRVVASVRNAHPFKSVDEVKSVCVSRYQRGPRGSTSCIWTFNWKKIGVIGLASTAIAPVCPSVGYTSRN